MKKVIVLMTLVLLLALSSQANAELMAIWDFGPDAPGYIEVVTTKNVNVIGTPTLSLSGGDIDGNGKDGTTYWDAAGTFHDAGQAGAWDDVRVSGADAEWIMTINTTGWEDMTLRFGYKAWDDSGIDSYDLDYSIDGGLNWNQIVSNGSMTPDKTWYSLSHNLSSFWDIENRASVMFRMDDLDRNGNKKFAFDNLELTGVPEPTTLVLLGIGGLMGLTRKRRFV